MAKKTYKPEEIVSKLRQVDVLRSQGMTMADAIRQISVSEVTFYRWRKGVWRAESRPVETAEGAREGEPASEASGV